jgi:hypothetical protein
MRHSFIYLILFSALFTSCFHDLYKPIQKVNLSDNEKYEVKSMSGCCGCEALYYNAYRDNILTEQFVVELRCELYKPTKHIFTYDKKGRVSSHKTFVAVFDSSYQYKLTDIDKSAFSKLDSIYATWSGPILRQIKFKQITGFKEDIGTHFPVEIRLPKS